MMNPRPFVNRLPDGWLAAVRALLIFLGGMSAVIATEGAFRRDGKPLPPPPPDEPAEMTADVARITALTADPAKIDLRGPDDGAQVVVTATLDDGTQADVTRQATFAAGELAAVDAFGAVRPLADGVGAVRITVGGRTAQVPLLIQGTADLPEPDYVHDIMPVVSKLGCNQGTCHGAKEGKNGFQLSLRGYDPVFDIRALTDDLSGRRVNVAFPDASLMLLKGSGAVPHEGGQVMTETSPYYRLLRRWIAAGAKADLASPRVTSIEVFPKNPVVQHIGARQQTRIVAHYADGKTRDVTSEAFIESGNLEVAKTDAKGLITTLRRGEAAILARFEGAYTATTVTVMGDRTGFAWTEPPANNPIDTFVAAKLQRTKTAPAPLCGDLEFIRRVTLDLTGLPPTPDEIRAFLADHRDSRWKRDLLIQKLIGSEAFLDYWTNKWCDLLQVNAKFLAGEGAAAFRQWIRSELAANTPYDDFARKVLTATGSTKDHPAGNYYKILRTPEETMENTTHLWLATRFNCNKCHDHPFERWTQDQYYEMTAFFARTGLERDPASGDRTIGGTAVEGATPLYELVINRPSGETKHLRTNRDVTPKFPYDVEFPDAPDASRRDRLAAWITSPDNPYFAKSFVNRLWGYLLGTGIIEPLDDIRAGNPPSNPELLDWLTDDFIKQGFDFRHVLKTICESRTYQLSLQTNRWNEDDTINFSHAQARRLPAEVLFDTIYAAAGAQSKFPGVPAGTRAVALADTTINTPDGFLGNLGKPARESSCECERSSDLQLGPVMALISGPTVGDALSDPENALTKLVAEKADDRALTDEIFLRFLGRPATAAEAGAAKQLLTALPAEHEQLQAELNRYEEELRPILAAREQQRQAEIAALTAEKTAHEAAIAPARAELERQRAEKLAATEAALEQARHTLPAKLAAWEETRRGRAGWQVLELSDASSTVKKTVFEKQDDGSLFVTGPDRKQAYTVFANATLPTLSGLRLEALADERLAANGPGRSGGGNFVLTELEVFWQAPGSTEWQQLAFSDARATFSQGGYAVKSALDGNTTADNNGWAIYPEGVGRTQTALFLPAAPVALPEGARLKFVLHQNYPDGKHSLGRFRLSLTNDEGELDFGVPDALLPALALAPDARTPEQTQALLDFLAGRDTDILDRQRDVETARQPVPPDATLEDLNARLARAEQPLPEDPTLARYRRDLALSTTQLNQSRLTAAQDLAWALINTPAFLFNR